jgi:hypothetical protein
VKGRLLGSVGVVLACAVGAAWLLDGLGDDASVRTIGGPLACVDCSRIATSIPAALGAPVSFGLLSLTNRGSAPAVVETIELVEPTPGIELVQALVGGPTGIGLLNGLPRRDPDNPLRPVRGFAVPRADPATDRLHQVILVLRTTRYGRSWFSRIAVDYRVGASPYRAVFEEGVALCSSRRGLADECALPPPARRSASPP